MLNVNNSYFTALQLNLIYYNYAMINNGSQKQ